MSSTLTITIEELTKAILDAYERGRNSATIPWDDEDGKMTVTPSVDIRKGSPIGLEWNPNQLYGTFGSVSISSPPQESYRVFNQADEAEYNGILADGATFIANTHEAIPSTRQALDADDDTLASGTDNRPGVWG
jgi:hypothetical protein